MKKLLLAVAAIAMISVNGVMASHNPTISIRNQTNEKLEVRDASGHQTSVMPNATTAFTVHVREQHGSWFPSALLPYKTVITVQGGKGSNSIEIDEHTKTVTVGQGLQLSKD